MSSCEWREERLGSSESLSTWGIAQLEIQKVACGGDTTRNAVLKQWREREMDWRLCWERNPQGKEASWRRRGSGSARTGRYDACWNRVIDVQRPQKDVCGDAGCYRRQSESSCKFRRWGGWGKWGWWRDWAGHPERRWRTRLGDGHNHPNGTAAHGEVSAEADEARQNWLNRDARMQLTTSVNEIRSTAHSNWVFRQSFSHKRLMTLQHLHQQHLESLWRVSTLSPEYGKGRQGLLDQEVVISGYFQWSWSQNRAYQAVSQLRSLIRQHCWKRSQLNQ